jgi:hypothetical protein
MLDDKGLVQGKEQEDEYEGEVEELRTPTVSATSFSVPGTTTTFTLGSSKSDHRAEASTNSVELG